MYPDSFLRRGTILMYGIFAYLIALGAQIWFIFYLGDWEFMPRTIYAPQQLPVWQAVMIDTGLVILFGLQHTGMARIWFKRYLLRFIPASAERSTYVLLSGIVMLIVVSLYISGKTLLPVCTPPHSAWCPCRYLGDTGYELRTSAVYIIVYNLHCHWSVL